jgi:nucleotide-binding universal stress UspA family protein
MLFGKILVPYDGSKQAQNALNKAVYLGSLINDSQIVILYVVSEIKVPPIVFDKKIRDYKTREMTSISGYLRNLRKDARDIMENRLDDLVRKYKNSVQIKAVITEGRPEVKIIEYANNHQINLIVIGESGLRGISRFMMGSVSRTISEKATCIVMIVR